MKRRAETTTTVHRRTFAAAALAGALSLWSSASAWAGDRFTRRLTRRPTGHQKSSHTGQPASRQPSGGAPRSSPDREPPIWLGHL